MKPNCNLAIWIFACSVLTNSLAAQEHRTAENADLLKPFWSSDVVYSEPVLFVRDDAASDARGKLLFPAAEILSVRDSTGTISYSAHKDYEFKNGAREIVVPVGSRIVTKATTDLRRPANSQRHRLTHRDGKGEILFGAGLEYHQMQTMVTYRKERDDWPVAMPTFNSLKLPVSIHKLRKREGLSIVLLGDSISTGCNASAWGNGAPHQPAYQDLLVQHLESRYRSKVTLKNLSVGGKSSSWGVTMVDELVAQKPDLVLIAFGMNDSARFTSDEYRKNIGAIIAKTRDALPNTEFILIASMLGNRDWTTLNHDVFPKYRDALYSLCKPGIVVADMTSVWEEFLKRKQDRDLTGNGVNHPNDFGHRVYAQVLAALLVDPGTDRKKAQ